MKAKFILDLSEAQWELYSDQAEIDNDGNPVPGERYHAEWTVDLPDGPWVQFTYGGLRDNAGGEIFGDLTFGKDGFFHHDDRVFSDLVIEFLPDEPAKCEAIIRHGPGHQSKSRCELTGPHDVHQTLVTGEILRWRGDEAFTGFFDESPED